MCVYVCIYTERERENRYVLGIRMDLRIYGIPKFPRRDSKPRRRLREKRAIPFLLLSLMCIMVPPAVARIRETELCN